MIRSLFSLILLFGLTASFAQLNVSYVGQIEYNQDLSDIWGYTAPNGDEYGLVGVFNGVSIVDLSDPSNPTELFFFPGAGSTWRDIKTYDGYAYVTNETGNGLAVIDLTQLPGDASAYDWAPNIPGEGTLSSIHNIWIDEFGVAYLAGSTLNSGGLLYVDVATTPGEPIYIDKGPAIYSHDVFTRENIMYSSEIYDGVFSIYDVTDKSNTVVLGSSPTEGAFTHNAWLSDDNTILYTTDEVAGAPVGAYDVSDPSDVQELDQFRPYETLGDGVIPHNVHVWEDWLIVSYYTDGCIIVDGSNPSNLVEVGNFDTFLPPSTGFSGAWGAYPYFDSGLIIVSDIGNGVYVLEPNYVNACWLEGNILDASDGTGIVGASISILNTIITDESGAQGAYATGYAVAGEYEILVEMPGYLSQTVTAELVNGVITTLDVQLIPLETFSASGTVSLFDSNEGIEGAMIEVIGEGVSYETTTGLDGSFTIEVFPGNYTVTAGQWGYITQCQDVFLNQLEPSVDFELSEGYYDDFSFDFGWSTTATAASGYWERDEPIATDLDGQPIAPGADIDGDCNGMAYVTGNGGGQAGEDDVDDGEVVLISPVIFAEEDLTPVLNFDMWWSNVDNTIANDEVRVDAIVDGETVNLLTLDADAELGEWVNWSLPLSGLDISNTIQFVFQTGDDDPNGSLVEVGVDNFSVDFVLSDDEFAAELPVSIYPNPSGDAFTVDLSAMNGSVDLMLLDAFGRVVERAAVNAGAQHRIGAAIAPGSYLLHLADAEGRSIVKPLVKY